MPNFQVFKFIYSCRLADMGLATQAFHYCEVIAKSILRQPHRHSPVLIRQLLQVRPWPVPAGPRTALTLSAAVGVLRLVPAQGSAVPPGEKDLVSRTVCPGAVLSSSYQCEPLESDRWVRVPLPHRRPCFQLWEVEIA